MKKVIEELLEAWKAELIELEKEAIGAGSIYTVEASLADFFAEKVEQLEEAVEQDKIKEEVN